MNKLLRIIQAVFGVPWLVFGAQHFVYVDFVAQLVPAFFPVRWFWVYLTGAAMIAAGMSLIVNRQAALAAALLGLMLLMFFLLIQVPKLIEGNPSAVNWTRVLQDFAIASTGFMLAGILSKHEADKRHFFKKIGNLSCYVFAALLIVFGLSQFFDLDFLTAKVPEYLPLRIVWVYLTGAMMIATGASVFINKKTRLLLTALGALLLTLNLLRYAPLFLSGRYNALLLTAAMLDLTITCGTLLLPSALPIEEQQ